MAERSPIEGPEAWYGRDLERSNDWIMTLTDEHRSEIADAFAGLKRAEKVWPAFTRRDFPLPATAALLAGISDTLENGRGLVRLRGLDVAGYSEDDLRQIFWGLGCYLGTALFQNARGEIMGEVRDETRSANPSFTQDTPGGLQSSRAKARSTGPLRFHTDRCDVIALLCARNAAAGGVSKLASSVTIHNEMLKRRPDLLELLFQDYWRWRSEDEDSAVGGRLYKLPVFGLHRGRFTSQYSRTFVELAQQIPEVPRLTRAQDEALDLLAEVAEEVCLHTPFEAGDIQLVNNHVVYHGRTAYDDDAGTRRERLLLRLWLSTPASRELPAGFEILWGETRPGALRGGVVQQASGSRTPVPEMA